MQVYNVKCPNCGKENKNVLLEDSRGFIECEKCGEVSRIPGRLWKIMIQPSPESATPSSFAWKPQPKATGIG